MKTETNKRNVTRKNVEEIALEEGLQELEESLKYYARAKMIDYSKIKPYTI